MTLHDGVQQHVVALLAKIRLARNAVGRGDDVTERSAPSRLAALSPRELDVLREMAHGRTNADIEQALHLSGSTVEKHVNAIFSKLGLAEEPVHRRVAAVLAYLQERG